MVALDVNSESLCRAQAERKTCVLASLHRLERGGGHEAASLLLLGARDRSAALLVAQPAAAADGRSRRTRRTGRSASSAARSISYLDLGPVKLARGNKVAPIWAFMNGHESQRNIIDTVPGQRSYTPLWAVNMVTWRSGATPRVLTSAAAVQRAQRAGQVTIANAPVVVNCPAVVCRGEAASPLRGQGDERRLDDDEAVPLERADGLAVERRAARGPSRRRAAAWRRAAAGTSPRTGPACGAARRGRRATGTRPRAGTRRSAGCGRCRRRAEVHQRVCRSR